MLMRSLSLAVLASFASLALSACCCPCSDSCGLPSCGCDQWTPTCGPSDPSSPPPQRGEGPVSPTAPTTPPTAPRTLPTSEPPIAQPEPLPPGNGTNLGIASHPAGTSLFDATMFQWLVPGLKPPAYRMGYALSDLEQRAIGADHDTYARSVKHQRVDSEIFTWVPPPGCGSDLHCPFEALARRNRPAVLPLAERFRKRATAAGLQAAQLAGLVIGFVQSIRYEVPRDAPFGVLPPALVAAEKRGDCDSKSLLALMILRELGIDGRLISSQAHRHTMLGVAIPASGKYFEHAGRRFAFVECTAEGAPIGFMDPRFSHPNDWRVVPIRL